jgi:L-fuconolactonase
MYRAEGDPKFVPIGETEFVNGIAAMSASGIYGPAQICAGIVGFADLLLGPEVDQVLEAHLQAAGERFKGVRYCSVWDADQSGLPSLALAQTAFSPPTVKTSDQ